MWQLHALLEVESTPAAPGTHQGVKNSDSPGTLCVVTIPCHMPAGMYDRRRRGIGHLAGSLPDHIRLDGCDAIRPLGCHVFHMLLQLVQTKGVALNIILVINIFIDKNVYPCQE